MLIDDYSAVFGIAAAIFVAFFIQTATGFGAMLIALTLASSFSPIAVLLSFLLPLSVVNCLSLTIKDRAGVDFRFLALRMLPLLLLGTALGRTFQDSVSPVWLQRVFGFGLAAYAIYGLARRSEPEPNTPRAKLSLSGAGLMQGLMGAGGPLFVIGAQQLGLDKRAFRGTLAAGFVVINVALTTVNVVNGSVDAGAVSMFFIGLAPLVLAQWVGEHVHRRAEPETFRRWVLLALLGGAALLLLR